MHDFQRPVAFAIAAPIYFLAASIVFGGESVQIELADPLPVAVSFVPEMQRFFEQGFSIPDSEIDLKPAITMAEAAWPAQRASIVKMMTPALVRALSRWARDEMLQYKKVTFPAKLNWTSAGCDAKRQRVLLETTIETLPSHSPLVTRRLKIYVVLNVESGNIEQAITTIQGEALE